MLTSKSNYKIRQLLVKSIPKNQSKEENKIKVKEMMRMKRKNQHI